MHLFDSGPDGQCPIADDLDLDGRRNGSNQSGKLRLDPVDGLDDIGAGLLEDDEKHAALAVGPGGLLHVFRPGDGPADVANPQWAAIAVGYNDVIPVLGIQQLIIGVNRVGALVPIDVALRSVDRCDRDLTADILQREPLGHQLRGVNLHANRGLLLAPDEHLGDAGNLTDLLPELDVDCIAYSDQRHGVRGRRQ